MDYTIKYSVDAGCWTINGAGEYNTQDAAISAADSAAREQKYNSRTYVHSKNGGLLTIMNPCYIFNASDRIIGRRH